MNKNKTHLVIDRSIEQRQGHGFRRHLGASQIGAECPRFLWYIFRWAKQFRAGARMLRLWDRGNREEERIVEWLRKAGVHVMDRDPLTGNQIRIEDHHGHFGGSLDAKLYDTPDFPGLWILGEFKTHAEKYFKALRTLVTQKGPDAGLREAAIKYYVQANIYMKYENLPYCLHFNVNKNDDDMEVLTLTYAPEVAERYVERAAMIIAADAPPPRISESASWYKCKWCDYRHICHEGEPKMVNCRTCVHSRPVENAQWICTAYGNYVLSEGEQRKGCLAHQMIPET